MPKKQPRNAYYFFMQDFKEEQRKKGIMYKNMAEVAEAAAPAWTTAPPHVRSKFEALAKQAKAKNNIPERKFTSTGVSLADIEAAEKEKIEAEKAELKDIKGFVTQHSVTKNLQNEDIYVIDVNCYCKAGTTYLIGEFTVLQFNLQEGIKESYHQLVQPAGIPIGYALDVKQGCEEFGLKFPDGSEDPSDYTKMFVTVVDFLQRGGGGGGGGRGGRGGRGQLPPLYTMPDKVQPVLDFIHQMCSRAVEDEMIFRVYRLDTLFYLMAQSLAKTPEDGLPKESLALAELKKDRFKYSPGIGCTMHEENDKSVECTLARARRWAYTLFDTCLPLLELPPRPVQHLPPDYHLDSILAVKEVRLARAAGPAARVAAPSECSFASDCSFSASNTPNRSQNLSDLQGSRVHVPLRKPVTDYSKAVRAPPLENSDFPRLAGRGRGRTMTNSFENMKI